MVDHSRKAPRVGRLKYFFLDKQLHRKIHINVGANTILAWNYPQRKRMLYNYRDVKKNLEPAFTTAQVVKMLDRSRVTLSTIINQGHIRPPQLTYKIPDGQSYKYMWHEDNIIEAQNYLAGLHRGAKRNDGLITPYPIPSEAEIRARIRHKDPLYVRVGDKFIPSWEAEDFDE